MDIDQVLERIFKYEATLIEIRNLTQPFNDEVWPAHPKNTPELPVGLNVSVIFPTRYKKIYELSDDLTTNQPPDYEISVNLRRHISFSEICDWKDINNRDLTDEFKKIHNYKEEFILIRLVRNLHPKIAATVPLLLLKDYDSALTKAFKGLETEARKKVPASTKSAVDLIRTNFSTKKLQYVDSSKQDAARDFLTGVLGLFRNYFLHNEIVPHIQDMNFCFPLLAIASEAYKILDQCT